MTDHAELIDRYIATWNEADAERRRALIARTWREDGRYVDPVMSGDGVNGIDAMIAGVQGRFPGFVMRRTGEIDAHNDRVRFSWALGPDGGDPVVGGVDFGVTDGARLTAITGFIDFAPA